MPKKTTKTSRKGDQIPVRTQLIVATGIVCLLVLFGMVVAWLDLTNGVKRVEARSYMDVTIKGTSVCLPHVNEKSGAPTTLECAQGIKTQGGVYYAISGSIDRTSDSNNTIEVTGTLTPPASDSRYVSSGTLTVK